MANCEDLFSKFHDKIKLTETKNDSLMRARDAIRRKIKRYFRDTLGVNLPNFRMQGSFAIRTTINPLSGEFDIDDGVYLNHLPEETDDWSSPSTVHNWIYNALENHTDKTPVDKRTCVRVIYASEYHVDLPIYGCYNGTSYLAEKGDNGWNESDPLGLKDWFIEEVQNNDEQLRRMVRFIKAWADYISSNSNKMPSSVILTVLTTEAYEEYERDDACLSHILNSIQRRMINSLDIYNPVDPTENLTERTSDAVKSSFLSQIEDFAGSSIDALQTHSKKEACKIWREYFGDRFENCDNVLEGEEAEAASTSSSAILRDDGRSA